MSIPFATTTVTVTRQVDTVTAGDNTVWTCLWARRETALGWDFMLGDLRLVTGAT